MTLEIDRIYCGDCLDLMREMPDKGVDLVLTDPPYGIGITDKRTVGGGNKAFGRPGSWVSCLLYTSRLRLRR